MSVQKYIKRPEIIEAIKWEGTEQSFLEIVEFLSKIEFTYKPKDGIFCFRGSYDNEYELLVGDYLVREGGDFGSGRFYIIEESVFEKGYMTYMEDFYKDNAGDGMSNGKSSVRKINQPMSVEGQRL